MKRVYKDKIKKSKLRRYGWLNRSTIPNTFITYKCNCQWCEDGRLRKQKRDKQLTKEQIKEYYEEYGLSDK